VPSAPSPSAAAPTPAAHTLPTGTQFRVQLQDTINSLRNSDGQTVTGLVSGDVRGPDGLTVLPSGSKVYVYIARLRPARTRSAADGELQLRVDSIMVDGQSYAVRADVGRVPHELRGRGVTAGEVEKVGAGTAAGAILGGVVTGKKKGAVIGGVVGAAGGAVVAAQTASRDVVVTPGTLLPVVLREPFASR
jgi:outer membrane protein with glycine zipper